MRSSSALFCALLAGVAVSCGGGETTKPPPTIITPPTPVVTSVSVLVLQPQLEVGGTTTLTVEVRDQNGALMAGKTPTWSSGSVAIATVNATTGVVTAVSPGVATISATVEAKVGTVNITVIPPAVASVAIDTPSAAGVAGGASLTLTATLKDKAGAVLTGRAITWKSSNTRAATIDATGKVVPLSAGTTTISALSETITGTLALTIAAPPGTVAPAITGITPATLAPGVTATINGTNLTSGGAGAAFIAGVAVPLASATPTQLTLVVPTSGLPCKSTQPANIEVTTVAGTAAAQQTLSVATPRTLAVGSSFLATATGSLCNELPATGTYLVSVFNAANNFTQNSGFELLGSTGGVVAAKIAPGDAMRSINVAAPPRSLRSAVTPEQAAEAREHLQRLERDMELVRQLGPPSRYRRGASRSIGGLSDAPSLALNPVPTVGQNTTIKFHYSSCSAASATPVTARVVYVGPKAIVLEDNASALAGKIDADLVSLAQEFEDISYPLLRNFGDPLAFDDSTDSNGRIFMLFTPQVNTVATNVLGFVHSCDFYPPTAATSVGSSNQAEIFFARAVTDTSSTSTSLNSRGGWKRQMPATLIHEAKHIAAFAERFASPLPASFEAVWLEEATAQMASEMYGRALHGNSWRGNASYGGVLDCEVRPSFPNCNGGIFVMGNHFGFLTDFLQNFELKTILSDGSDSDIYGSSWLFMRWLTDTYGGTNEGAFLSSIVKSVQLTGVRQVTAATGKTFAELLAQFTLMLAADDLAGMQAPFIESSWNLPGVFAGYNSDFPSRPQVPLRVRSAPFGAFTVNDATLKGGGAMLMRLGGSTITGTQLLDLHAAGGAALPATSFVGVSVLRVQ